MFVTSGSSKVSKVSIGCVSKQVTRQGSEQVPGPDDISRSLVYGTSGVSIDQIREVIFQGSLHVAVGFSVGFSDSLSFEYQVQTGPEVIGTKQGRKDARTQGHLIHRILHG